MASSGRVTKPDAAWTRGAKAAAKKALEPLFRALGLEGSFPKYRRAEAAQVKVVAIDVRVRTGVTVEILSLPPRSMSGTWRSEKLRKIVLNVRSATALPALARKLATASRVLRRDALAFWSASEGHWSGDARAAREDNRDARAGIARMLLDGDARKLAAAASRLDEGEFAAAVATAGFRYDDESAHRAIWRCADVLIERDPPTDEIAASLLVSAIDHLGKKADAKSRARAKAVLRWGEPHLRERKRVAAQVRHVARARVYDGERAGAAAIFELALGADASAVEMASALCSVLSDNPRYAPDRALQERILSLATKAYPKDRYVQINAACLSAALGEDAAAAQHLLAALKLGIDPKAVVAQAGLRSALLDPRVMRALRGARAPKSGAGAAAGVLPP